VFITSHKRQRGEAALIKLRQESNNGNVELIVLDLTDATSVKYATESFLKRNVALHGLYHLRLLSDAL
jgi:hypothetical protein